MSGIEQGGEDDDPILKVLELSYQDLPFYLKPCFLYLGNFPEDCKISTERLYHLWEAEGLLEIKGEDTKGGTSYDIGERYLNELVQRSMIQVGECWTNGRIKTCHVHDVMRDLCLRKCEGVSFLHYIECTGSDVASTLPPFSNEVNKLRRCAVYDERGYFLDRHVRSGERVVGLRSLLVFHEKEALQKVWKAFPLLRVLDVEGTHVDSVDGVGHLIHLRYLSLRNSRVNLLPSCLYDLKYLETLDLRGFKWKKMKICNEFYKMKRLRHLYFPREFEVEGQKKLVFPIGGQLMETIKHFDPGRCKKEELMQMTNLRVFSITRGYIFEKAEELKWVLEAPVMKKAEQLINTFRIRIREDVIREDPGVLSSAAHHPCFNELILEGLWRSKDRNVGNADNTNGIIFPERLTVVKLQACEIRKAYVLALEKLPHLEILSLEGSSTIAAPGRDKLGFSPWSFLKLTQLSLSNLVDELEELEVGEGALPNLRLLKLNRCKELKNIPNSLTQVEIRKCEIGEQGCLLLLALEKLPRLQQLEIQEIILSGSGGINKLSFSPAGFPQLSELNLTWYHELTEWEVGDGALPNLRLLKLRGCRKLNKLNNIPNSLTRVLLEECGIGEAAGGVLLSALENLPCLQQLDIWYSTIRGDNKMSFSPRSFPQLRQLGIYYAWDLKEWEVGDGALPNLQCLKLIGCDKLKKLPEGLPANSVHIE